MRSHVYQVYVYDLKKRRQNNGVSKVRSKKRKSKSRNLVWRSSLTWNTHLLKKLFWFGFISRELLCIRRTMNLGYDFIMWLTNSTWSIKARKLAVLWMESMSPTARPTCWSFMKYQTLDTLWNNYSWKEMRNYIGIFIATWEVSKKASKKNCPSPLRSKCNC